jgi:hypothetical protein
MTEDSQEVVVRRLKSLLPISLIVASVGLGSSSFAREEGAPRIARVENGLRPYSWVLFGDEPRLNILERMKHYRVPGVSIAVIEHGLGANKTAAAIAILKLNTEWYPGSWNTFDSLGEAFAAAEEKERARATRRRSS